MITGKKNLQSFFECLFTIWDAHISLASSSNKAQACSHKINCYVSLQSLSIVWQPMQMMQVDGIENTK
jgi:hypothetical protein